MKQTILLADNNQGARERWARVLREAGYEVYLAKNPEEAREILDGEKIGLAILDLRLEQDTDEHDLSGVWLAKERAYRDIPKIILTAFQPRFGELRDVLGTLVDELPHAVA